MIRRNPQTDLNNWREAPHSQWSFQNVRELIPTAPISCDDGSPELNIATFDFADLKFDSPQGSVDLPSIAERSHSDSLVILNRGKLVYQWSAPHVEASNPHIIFSISKSLTAMLAGIIEDQGELDPSRPAVHYLPKTKGSAYEHCTVQQVLDMTVSLNFEENYTDKESEYVRYREATAWHPARSPGEALDLETFLYSLRQGDRPHGQAFSYHSPNSDLLGLILQRVTDMPLANLFSDLLWQPMGATSDGSITVDRKGLARGAGGICITAIDLAKVGQLFLNDGYAKGQQVISERWLHDTRFNCDQGAWNLGNYKQRMPNGNYRNKWYQLGDADGSICARGIHGQLLYINPTRDVVIVRLSSHPDPINDRATAMVIAAFEKISLELSLAAGV